MLRLKTLSLKKFNSIIFAMKIKDVLENNLVACMSYERYVEVVKALNKNGEYVCTKNFSHRLTETCDRCVITRDLKTGKILDWEQDGNSEIKCTKCNEDTEFISYYDIEDFQDFIKEERNNHELHG